MRHLINLPNAVTLVRVLVLPAAVIALRDGDRVLLALWGGVIGVSDFLDGWLARRLGQVTEWGKLLDPAADKVATVVLVWALWAYTPLPGWALVLILAKDGLIVAGGMWAARRFRAPLTPNVWGKGTVAAQFLVFLCYGFGWSHLQTDALGLMTLLIWITLFTYGRLVLLLWRCPPGGSGPCAQPVSAYGFRRDPVTGRPTLESWLVWGLLALVGFRLIWLLVTWPAA